jgi:hypothetical protein
VEELIDHLAACIRAHRAGDMSQPIALDNYRIVPCDQPDSWEPIIIPEDYPLPPTRQLTDTERTVLRGMLP